LTPDAPSDPPLRRAVVDGRAVAWSLEGPAGAPVLLCLPGLPGSHRDFRWLAPACLPEHRVLRLDFPGFGASEPPEAAQDEPARAAVARAVLDEAGVERCVAVGHSVGGAVAAALATAAPDRVGALVLLASPGERPHLGFRLMPFRVAAAGLARGWSKAATLRLTRFAYVQAGFPRSLDDAAVEWTARCAARVDFAAHGARVRALAARGLPTMVAWAEDDRIVEAEISRELAAIAGPGPRLRFPDGGHNLQKTRAVELAAALRGWDGVRH
jgi:pimeloyl-ACP methyl ester carboxylesterase